MGRHQKRRVAWWVDPLDLMPQGDPETTAVLSAEDVVYGLHIRSARGTSLGILTIQCRLGPNDRVYPQKIIGESEAGWLDVQSNPRRAEDEDGS